MFGLTVNQRHSRTVSSAGADSSKVAVQKLCTPYFQTFLYNLGGKLIHAIIPRMPLIDSKSDAYTLLSLNGRFLT
jgi:hypothetical protein